MCIYMYIKNMGEQIKMTFPLASTENVTSTNVYVSF